MSLVSTLSSSHIDPPATLAATSPTTTTSTTLVNLTDDNEDAQSHHLDAAAASVRSLLGAFANRPESSSMDRGAPEYPQTGLHSPFPTAFPSSESTRSETSPADPPSAVQYASQEAARANNYSTSATPTSDFGVNPASARSASFPEHIQRQYYPASNHSGSSGGMAQSTSPSMSLQDGRPNHRTSQLKSDAEVPIDPSIATSSPTYPPHGGQYSPYPQQDMSHGYPQHPGGAMYATRPDWAGYSQHPQHGMPAPYPGGPAPTSAAPAGARPNQVYSFVPIPGAQQHKRPRRRYEEIERMYKCGWNGCEKAYGTLNHLNAHVTMQAHGNKRTPEEFKEIRKEWKARKKEEESQRKAEEERARSAQAQANPGDAQGPPDGAQPPAGYQQAGRPPVQLPPIAYQPGAQVPGQYQGPPGAVQQLQEYGGGHMYSGYPASPYGTSNQMYSQHNGAAPKYEH